MDLASYLMSMNPQQRQMLVAEQARAKSRSAGVDALSAAQQSNPGLRTAAMAALLSGNKDAAKAAGFAHDSDLASRKATQLGQTGFFAPNAGFIGNPMYEEERDATRENTRAIAEASAEQRAQAARDRYELGLQGVEQRRDAAEQASADRREARALRHTIAQMSAGNAAARREEAEDNAAFRSYVAAEKLADADNKEAEKARGSGTIPTSESFKLEAIYSRVQRLDELTEKAARGGIGSQGTLQNRFTEEPRMWIARNFENQAKAIGDEEAIRKNEWWSEYRREFENLQRNEMFGSALTAPERQLWEASNINSGMTDESIQKVIATKQRIARDVLTRVANSMAANGRNVDAIEQMTGGFYKAPPRPPKADPARYLPRAVQERLRKQGILNDSRISTPPSGAVKPEGGVKSKPVTDSEGWSMVKE